MGVKSSNQIEKIAIYTRLAYNGLTRIQRSRTSGLHFVIVTCLVGILLTTATATSSYGQSNSAQPIQSQASLPNTVFISSNNTVHELPLKALNTDGQVSKATGFKIDMAKVALISPSTPNINAFSADPSLAMIGAKLRNNTQGFDLPGTPNTYTYSLAGVAQGVYTLDVMAQKGNNQGAYETILVIGPP